MVPTQANRLIALNTPLGPDALLLRAFSGQEALSRLFSFELDLLATDPEIKFEDIIGKRVSIRVILGDEEERYFNGFISRFMQTGSDTGLANYRATMVPWLWFLTRTADCRIFQNKKIPNIIQQIFKEMGFTDVKTVLKGTYEPRDYCVQYRETDFNFVSRLMEQYGIFYYFEHEEKKHTLVLADDLSAHQPCPKQSSVKWNPHGSDALAEDVITSLQWEQSFRSGKYAVTDYNFETPSTSLMAEVKTQLEVGGNGKFEIYDFPGEYGKKADGDKIAKIRMEEEEAQHLVISGASTCRVFTAGYRFTLQEYGRKDLDGDYVLTQVQHFGSVGNTYTTTANGEAGEGDYTNSFTCIPYKVPYRPQQVTPKPMVQGPQTAVVVGKAGEEIWTDKYGRVKVQFHWDRYGKKNEDSSCWVRVSQNWAGKQWGAMFLPRIGQEVIVEFIEGDPDQPIITGRVYNAEQLVPYPLPAEQTKSTIKSNSSKGGGGSNEIRFEDKKGGEEIYLHGQKDWTIAIENDKNQIVGHDETLSVGNNQAITIGVDQTEKIGSNLTLMVGAAKTEVVELVSTETVGGAKALTIGAAYQVSVAAAMNETVGGLKAEQVGAAKSEAVGGSKSESIGGGKTFSAGKDFSENVGGNHKVTVAKDSSEEILGKSELSVKKDYIVQSSKKICIQAGDEILIKTGSASILMKKNGDIEIQAKKFTVKASGEINLKGQKISEN
jgi:type VI secretion system secreted protein VgrG